MGDRVGLTDPSQVGLLADVARDADAGRAAPRDISHELDAFVDRMDMTVAPAAGTARVASSPRDELTLAPYLCSA